MITAFPAIPRTDRKAHGFAARCAVAATALVLGVAAFPAKSFAADPQGDYATLFGEEEKKVMATPSTKDDAAFAAKILSRAAELKDAPELQRYIYARAMVLGGKDPEGLDTAVEAGKLLVAVTTGADKLTWQSKLVDLYYQQYRRATGQKRIEAGNYLVGVISEEAQSLASQSKYADASRRFKEAQGIASSVRSDRADELGAAAKDMQSRQQVLDRLEKLRTRLDTQGGDLNLLEQVILGYLLELDDWTTATKLAAGHPDKSWERMLKVAATDTSRLDEKQQFEVAVWFRQIAAKTKGDAKTAALSHAAAYLIPLRQSHTKKDAERLQILRELDQVASDLQTCPGSKVIPVVIWNSHNGQSKDRGTRIFNIVLFLGDRPIWRRDAIPIDWFPTSDGKANVAVPAIPFDRMRIEVTGYVTNGAALSEVEIWRDGHNVALKAYTESSGVFANLPAFASDKLTDGLKERENASTSWVPPDKSAAWVDIYLIPPEKKSK